jgi:hypothetical protein
VPDINALGGKQSKEPERGVQGREEWRNQEQQNCESARVKEVQKGKLSFGEGSGGRRTSNALDFKPSPHANIFNPSSSKSTELPVHLTQVTPARPSSPTKGILMTPGAAVSRRKVVSFDPALADETPKPKNSRVRSGLPSDFPGKFPSPWTPRIDIPLQKRSVSIGSLEETSLSIEPTAKKRAAVSEQSRIGDLLDESDHDDYAFSMPDSELTTDMSAPKSASGKYWKEHAESLEGLAITRVDKLKDRCNTAIDYAKRKDELCANLGEKVREMMDKNKLLKDEIKRLNLLSQFSGRPDANTLSEAMQMLTAKEATIKAGETEMARMQSVIDQYEARLQGFDEMLHNREENIAELSMMLYDGENLGDNVPDSIQVTELKQKLRKARQELKELGSVRTECRNSKSKVAILEKEKENLEAQLERMKSIGDETGLSRFDNRSSSEARLRAQVDDLEKGKRDLKAEMRSKASEASRERREAEKALRTEIADLKTKLVGEELDKKELQRQVERLKSAVEGLEKDHFGHSSGAYSGGDWQKKHRAVLLELRQAKEELVTLRMQINQPHRHSPPRFQTASSTAPMSSTDPKETTPPQKHRETISKEVGSPASDDSAIDRTYDRNSTTASRAHNRVEVPRKALSSVLDHQPMPKPYDDIANSSLLLLPGSPAADDHTALKPIEANATRDRAGVSAATPRRNNESFASVRRAKMSPRPSVINWGGPPRPTKKRALGVRKTTVGTKPDGTDTARWVAAEKRIAERKAKRMAERIAAAAAHA